MTAYASSERLIYDLNKIQLFDEGAQNLFKVSSSQTTSLITKIRFTWLN